MSEDSAVVVGRRGSAEVARLAGLYRSSGMGRGEFCRRHGLSLSTLTRHLQKQFHQPHRTGEEAGHLPSDRHHSLPQKRRPARDRSADGCA